MTGSTDVQERKLLQIFATRLKTEGMHRRIYSNYTRSLCGYVQTALACLYF